jgi:hypothetical protein
VSAQGGMSFLVCLQRIGICSGMEKTRLKVRLKLSRAYLKSLILLYLAWGALSTLSHDSASNPFSRLKRQPSSELSIRDNCLSA